MPILQQNLQEIIDALRLRQVQTFDVSGDPLLPMVALPVAERAALSAAEWAGAPFLEFDQHWANASGCGCAGALAYNVTLCHRATVMLWTGVERARLVRRRVATP